MIAIVIGPEDSPGNGPVIILDDDTSIPWTEAWCLPAAQLVSQRDTRCD